MLGVVAEEGLFTCRAKHLIRLTHKSVASLLRDFRLPRAAENCSLLPTFRQILLELLNLEGGTGGLSINVGKKIQFYAAHNSTSPQISICKSDDGISLNLALTLCQ